MKSFHRRKTVLALARSMVLANSLGLLCLLVEQPVGAADRAYHFRCQTTTDSTDGAIAKLSNVQPSKESPGPITARGPVTGVGPLRYGNSGCWDMDGRTSIVWGPASNAAGLAENFTWEGFFLSRAGNSVLPETGIADRLISQFAYDKGNWTRLAVGLTADRRGAPRLCVSLEGFEGRTFGLGKNRVERDRWHHFAVVHEGTAAAGAIRWYLDYQLCGQLFLGGQSNQNTLRPPGSAAFTFGARLMQGAGVNRGFDGLLDEIRLTPRPLTVAEFLRSPNVNYDNSVPQSQPAAPDFWMERHTWARGRAKRWTDPSHLEKHRERSSNLDLVLKQALSAARPIDEARFLRRLYLTVLGRIPTLAESRQFTADTRSDKRQRAIDRVLADPEWADGWVGFWQDLLAENPSVVFPTLNNSGPFRQWIHDSFRRNKPLDQFVTELTLMDPMSGEDETAAVGHSASPAGFALATGNDVPMAMRAHVLMNAFAGIDLKCARCHDSPTDRSTQFDLFLLAAYLGERPLEVPKTSMAAVGKHAGSITSVLSAGQKIRPRGLERLWFFPGRSATQLKPVHPSRPRAQLAALITSPDTPRFTDVMATRIWHHLCGQSSEWGLQLLDDDDDGSRAAVLQLLSRKLIESGYDAKSLARFILSSRIWQSNHAIRRRMSAEQLVDSLFVAVGKDFQAETLGVHATDPGAAQLPRPRRAWQFAALPNERDRPSLAMPVNQTIVDVLQAFDWNGNRQQPLAQRPTTFSALQPLILFHGLMSQRIVRLSDDSGITELCLQSHSPRVLVDALFLSVLSRPPDPHERQAFVDYLTPGYTNRRTAAPRRATQRLSSFQPDWRKHLEPEQTLLMQQARRTVARGTPPTARLTVDFRKRVEDVVWALINSPEFVVIP